MNFSSTLQQVSNNSSFKWTINNIQKIDWKKGFSLKSKEVTCKEANIRWHLKLIPFIYDNQDQVFITIKFFVKEIIPDENAKYKFDIALNENLDKDRKLIAKRASKNPNAIILESDMMSMSTKNGNFDFQFNRFFALGKNDEKIELTPKITIETIKYECEDENSDEELEETLTDETITEENTSQSDVSENSENSCSCQEMNEKPIQKMSDTELALKISEIYLQKMRTIADTSGRLMVSAARGNIPDLLTDCMNSLAGQITIKNFFDIWEIAIKLNIPELKQKVITFFVANRSKISYDSKMSPEFMLSFVRAMD